MKLRYGSMSMGTVNGQDGLEAITLLTKSAEK
jgi:hypothetical protein